MHRVELNVYSEFFDYSYIMVPNTSGEKLPPYLRLPEKATSL